jgi:membrane-bound lytic murein transglycosylase D
MDLRAFLHTQLLVFLFICLKGKDVFAFNSKKDFPLVPYEIKFADVTFQLTDVTRYLVQTELKNIQTNKSNLHQQLDKFNLFLPIVEPILKEKSVPDDFKFLMIYNKYQSSIETSISFENDIYWCLDREKADDVDLIVNDQYD